MAAALPGRYKLLSNKYYVDEIYGATVVKPLLGFSRYVLGWVVDIGLLGGLAWLLGGLRCLPGAILQRWQSGNLRSYAAWLAAGAAAVLLFCCCAVESVLAGIEQFKLELDGTLRMDAINQSILTLILLVPLAGAVLVALVPDRFKLPNWIALLTTLANFRTDAASARAFYSRPGWLPV